MSGTPSWRTLLIVALAAFGLALFRLSASTLETVAGKTDYPCKIRIISNQIQK